MSGLLSKCGQHVDTLVTKPLMQSRSDLRMAAIVTNDTSNCHNIAGPIIHGRLILFQPGQCGTVQFSHYNYCDIMCAMLSCDISTVQYPVQ